MSITSDIRSYADNAIGQAQQAIGQAQAQIAPFAERYNESVTKLTETAKNNASELRDKLAAVSDIRAQAEKAINLDAIKSAVEPFLAQAKSYAANVSEQVEKQVQKVLGAAAQNPQFQKVFAATAPQVIKVVDAAKSYFGLVQAKVVQPVASLTSRSTPALTGDVAAEADAVAPVKKPTRRAPAKKAAPAPVAEVVEPAVVEPAEVETPAEVVEPTAVESAEVVEQAEVIAPAEVAEG